MGVTAGLGVPSIPTWKGNRSTAPDTPAGVATVAMTKAAAKATTYSQSPVSTGSRYPLSVGQDGVGSTVILGRDDDLVRLPEKIGDRPDVRSVPCVDDWRATEAFV